MALVTIFLWISTSIVLYSPRKFGIENTVAWGWRRSKRKSCWSIQWPPTPKTSDQTTPAWTCSSAVSYDGMMSCACTPKRRRYQRFFLPGFKFLTICIYGNLRQECSQKCVLYLSRKFAPTWKSKKCWSILSARDAEHDMQWERLYTFSKMMFNAPTSLADSKWTVRCQHHSRCNADAKYFRIKSVRFCVWAWGGTAVHEHVDKWLHDPLYKISSHKSTTFLANRQNVTFFRRRHSWNPRDSFSTKELESETTSFLKRFCAPTASATEADSQWSMEPQTPRRPEVWKDS